MSSREPMKLRIRWDSEVMPEAPHLSLAFAIISRGFLRFVTLDDRFASVSADEREIAPICTLCT